MRRRIVRRVGDDMRLRLACSIRRALEVSEGDVLELSVSERGEVLLQRATDQDREAPTP